MSDRHPRHGSNTMAIRTHDFAFRDLSLGLGDAFGIAHVQRLDGPDMIEVKRRWMGFVTAVYAPVAHLVRIQPVADASRAIVCLAVRKFSIPGPLQSYLPPSLDLFRGELAARARSLAASIRTKLRLAFGGKRAFAMAAYEILGCGLIPWRHSETVPSVAYPCKPDIFAATYEPVEA